LRRRGVANISKIIKAEVYYWVCIQSSFNGRASIGNWLQHNGFFVIAATVIDSYRIWLIKVIDIRGICRRHSYWIWIIEIIDVRGICRGYSYWIWRIIIGIYRIWSRIYNRRRRIYNRRRIVVVIAATKVVRRSRFYYGLAVISGGGSRFS
jgi:hypothetical protein